MQGEGAGDGDALALPAGELAGLAVERRGRQGDAVEELGRLLATAATVPTPNDRNGSAITSPTVKRGFSDV